MMGLLRFAGLALLTLAPTSPLLAQDYPSRQVRVIVPFGAGGPADVYARVIAHHLSEELKQTFVVEDRPGAGSIIGTDAVAKSAPDGYTLLVMSNTHTTNETLVSSKPYQLMRDFVPVATLNYSDLMMVVHPSVPAKDLKEFIALAKSKPGELNYASSGTGTPYHMAGELFKAMSGTNIVHVPHKASGEARNAVIGGHVQMMFDAITTMAPNAHAGCADHRGSRRARLRGNHLARHHGAGGHPERDRRKAQQRDQQGDRAAGREGSLGQAGRGADADDSCPIRQVSAGRHRKVGQRREGLGRQGELIVGSVHGRDLLHCNKSLGPRDFE